MLWMHPLCLRLRNISKVVVLCCILLYFIEDVNMSRALRSHACLGHAFVFLFLRCSKSRPNLFEDWRAVEFFAGAGNLTASLKQLSFRTIRLDYDYAPGKNHFDLLKPAGMALLVRKQAQYAVHRGSTPELLCVWANDACYSRLGGWPC